MSARFPHTVTCPHCGLEVAGNARSGKIRAHSRKAVEAGKVTAECARQSREAQEREARQHRLEAGPSRREYWASRDRPTTITDEGTAQRRPIRKG